MNSDAVSQRKSKVFLRLQRLRMKEVFAGQKSRQGSSHEFHRPVASLSRAFTCLKMQGVVAFVRSSVWAEEKSGQRQEVIRE
jgi:hypothetical protein